MISKQIFYAPVPDPATLQEQKEFTVIIHDGQITGDLCKNTTDLIEFMREAGIEYKPVIEFCG